MNRYERWGIAVLIFFGFEDFLIRVFYSSVIKILRRIRFNIVSMHKLSVIFSFALIVRKEITIETLEWFMVLASCQLTVS